MSEKVLNSKKNGMAVLLSVILMYVIATAAVVLSGISLNQAATPLNITCLTAGIIVLSLGWILLPGLRVLKPQEALVLTLFGKYVGTLKENGFYFVNPFCVGVNPASRTRLSQSGDVSESGGLTAIVGGAQSMGMTGADFSSKKLSLKIMTLNNSRQKINDCLGNPVEIGIAVTWRIVDTAKAVFNVDNYKEFLSLQCDSALRHVVRIYPYDVSPNVDTTGDGVAACGVPARLWLPESARRSRHGWKKPESRSWKPELLISHTPLKLPPSCCSASRPPLSLTPVK